MGRDLVPMVLGDILDEAFDLYKHNLSLFAGIVAALHVPAHIAWLLIYYGLGLDRIGAVEGDSAAQVWAALMAAAVWIAMALLYTFLAVVQNGALTIAISERYLERPVTVREAYTYAARRLWALIAAWAVVFACVGAAIGIAFSAASVMAAMLMVAASTAGDVGAVAGVVMAVVLTGGSVGAGVVVAVWLGAFVTQAVVIEGRSVGASISRSAELVKGQVLRTSGAAIVILLLSAAVLLAATQSTDMALEYLVYSWLFVPTVVRETVSSVVGGFIWIFMQPLWMTCLTLLYYDRRVRREGFDLALLEHQLAPAAPRSRP